MVCLNVCSGAEQRKHQNSASLVFVRGIHRWSANFPHKGPITRKIFHWWRHHGISIESVYTVLTNTHNNTLTTCIIIGHYSDRTGASWWLISTPIRLTHTGKHYIPRYWFFVEWIPCTKCLQHGTLFHDMNSSWACRIRGARATNLIGIPH